jgi:hypothetical protein
LYLSLFFEKIMGKCVYCGHSAGWFRSKHIRCVERYHKAKLAIENLVANTLSDESKMDGLFDRVKELSLSGFLTPDERKYHSAMGLMKGIEDFVEDHVLSDEEYKRVESAIVELEIDHDLQRSSGLSQRIAKSLTLTNLNQGEIPTDIIKIPDDLPFLIQKSETIVWIFDGVSVSERTTQVQYQGSSSGVSIRIMRGVYYRTGAFRGHPVEVEKMKPLGRGSLAFTTKHVLFVSPKTSLKIPISKLLAIQAYENGLQIQRDGVRSKPILLSGLDVWFASNVLSLLFEGPEE